MANRPNSKVKRFNLGGMAGKAGASIPLTAEQKMEEKKEEKMRSMGRTKSGAQKMEQKKEEKMMPIKKEKGGEAKKKPPGLYANIHAKRKRIAAGSGEKMRKVGSKGAPTKQAFIKSKKTAKG